MMDGFFDLAVPANEDAEHYFIRQICGPSGNAR
jgi:hypothetical protein